MAWRTRAGRLVVRGRDGVPETQPCGEGIWRRKVHGRTPTLVLVEELHAHADNGVYTAMRTSMQKRAGTRMVVVSTAGQGAETALDHVRARALAQLT